MKTRGKSKIAALVAAAALAAGTASAEQHWIVSAPTVATVAKAWKEGSIADRSEDGRSFVAIETDGAGNPVLAAVKGIPATDSRGRFVAVTLRVHDIQHLQNLQLRLGSDGLATSWYALPVQIFADTEYNFVQEDTWASVTLPFALGEVTGKPDRAKIDSFALMATDDGKGKVTVDFAGAALVDGPKEGVVSFTFDDGYKEHLEAARMFAARGWKGTAYIIPFVLGSQPGYLTVDDVAQIARLGWDVAAHDDPPFTSIPADQLEPRIRGIHDWLVQHGYPQGAEHLAYPLGKQEPKRVRPTIARVFTTARIAGGGPETFPPADPHLLRAINVIAGTKPEEVADWARRARDDREWLILMMHWLPEKTQKPTDYAMSDFKKMLDLVAATKVRVAPMTEVWHEAAPIVAAETMFPPASSPAKPAP
jgi:peptidoglycan/xylan/chitin deacetylase (PgdA/CDA1 family)